MPHSKCLHCGARVWRERTAREHPPDLCPGCGRETQLVADLNELVGLRALRVRPHQAHRNTADESDRISQQIRETIANSRRNAGGESTPR